MTTGSPALTGTVAINHDMLVANIGKVERLLTDLDDARSQLELITTRPLRQAWSSVPSLVSFAGSYVDACATTIAIIDQAELKVVGMADSLRAFVTEMYGQDQAALDALTALEEKVADALAAAPLPTPDVQYNGRIIKTHQHQQPI